MAIEELTLVFRHGSLSADIALSGIQALLTENQVPLTGFELYGEALSLTQVSARLRTERRNTFKLIGRGFVFHLASVRNFDLDFLSIKSTVSSREAWDTWASRFIGHPNFIMAWVADAEYEFWQNAEDPLEYRSRGKSYDHLPQKTNELPPPLEQTIIDISHHPGRRLMRSGYYEVVGAVMWLGGAFWELVGANREKVTLAEWLQVSKPLQNVVKIEAAGGCFKTSDGLSDTLQRKLRDLLFPNSE